MVWLVVHSMDRTSDGFSLSHRSSYGPYSVWMLGLTPRVPTDMLVTWFLDFLWARFGRFYQLDLPSAMTYEQINWSALSY